MHQRRRQRPIPNVRHVSRHLPRRLQRLLPAPFLPRWAARLVRSRTFALLVAGTAALRVSGTVERADRERRQWGEQRPAVVAVRDVRAGARLTASDVEVRSLPRRLVPAGVAGSLAPIVGKTTRIDLAPDEVVTPGSLSGTKVSAAELLVGPGRVGVSVETGPGRPNLSIGNAVIVIPSPDVTAARAPMVVDASVVALADNFVTVSVATSDAPVLAAMIGAGPVFVALKGR
jgi:SAF domain